VVNLATFVDKLGNQPIVIKDAGKGIKSIAQYYLKKQKQLQIQYAQQQRQQLKDNTKLSYGNAYYKLKETWRRKLKDAITNSLVTWWTCG